MVGQSLADAQATLVGAGLRVGKVTQAYDARVASGDVISQTPEADILLAKGDPVDLVVSRGVQLVPVPTGLVGLTDDEARASLQAVGLKVAHVVNRNSLAPAARMVVGMSLGGRMS